MFGQFDCCLNIASFNLRTFARTVFVLVTWTIFCFFFWQMAVQPILNYLLFPVTTYFPIEALPFSAISSGVALFWALRQINKEQWNYCADLYNKCTLEADPLRRLILRNSLAVDVLTMDLWNHKHFREVLAIELVASLPSWASFANRRGVVGSSSSKYLKRISQRRLRTSVLLRILERHHLKLLGIRTEFDVYSIKKQIEDRKAKSL